MSAVFLPYGLRFREITPWPQNMAAISTVVVGVPELLSENVKKSDKPLPSSEAVGKHQKKNPTATLAESINDLRGE